MHGRGRGTRKGRLGARRREWVRDDTMKYSDEVEYADTMKYEDEVKYSDEVKYEDEVK